MKRLEFLALIASPALVFIPVEKPDIAIYVGGKKIGELTSCKFTPYRMTANNIKVSKELVETFK